MKKKKQLKTKTVRERAAVDMDTPGRNDFFEIPMTHEALAKVAQENSHILDQRNDPIIRKHTVRRQEKLLRKSFKAAAQVLTDAQFNIFVQRYVYNFSEKEIAAQIGRNQSYIPAVLKASVKKIQKRLRLLPNLMEFSKDRKDKS